MKTLSFPTSPNTKPQIALSPKRLLGFWNLVFFWSLVFGIWCLFPPATFAADTLQTTRANENQFDFVSTLFVFMLATFVGLEVIRRVSRLLHTPLMSLTNAIAALAAVGAMIVGGPENRTGLRWVGFVAVVAPLANSLSVCLCMCR